MCFRIFFVLNRVRVSNPQGLTYTKILVKYPPGNLPLALSPCCAIFCTFFSPTVGFYMNLLGRGVFSFPLKEGSCPIIWVKALPKNARSLLPVDVHQSKMTRPKCAYILHTISFTLNSLFIQQVFKVSHTFWWRHS